MMAHHRAHINGHEARDLLSPVDTRKRESSMSEIEEKKPAVAAAKGDEPASEKEVINTFQTMRQEVQQLFTKINELENEKSEHNLVIGASPLCLSLSLSLSL